MIEKELETMKETILADLAQLVAIDSTRDLTTAKEGAPFGSGIQQAFLKFEEIAKRLGFEVHNDQGYAIYAQTSAEETYVAALGHLDVVEIGERHLWDSNPFVMHIKNNVLYGRGVNDDKGPLLIALYAAYLLKQKHQLRYPIRIIAGGAEETTWECMHHYFQHHPQPRYAFSPDGNFPIVNGEKGILQVRFLFPGTNHMQVHSGKRLNFVCDDITITIPQKSVYQGTLADWVQSEGDKKHIHYQGVKSLSRNPQRGENAIFKMTKEFVRTKELEPTLDVMLKLINEQFLDDFYGEKSGLYASDEEMGTTSVCLMSMEANTEYSELCIDVRYVKSIEEETLLKQLQKIADNYGAQLEILHQKRLLYVDKDSKLIRSLQNAYERVMHESAEVITKGGASYARVLDHGIAFGATFANEDPRPHMPNECMSIASLLKACEIYYEAFYELAVKEE